MPIIQSRRRRTASLSRCAKMLLGSTALVGAGMVVATPAYAADDTWSGGTTAWFTAANWSGGLPDASTPVVIDTVTNPPTLSTSTGAASTLTVGVNNSTGLD